MRFTPMAWVYLFLLIWNIATVMQVGVSGLAIAAVVILTLALFYELNRHNAS